MVGEASRKGDYDYEVSCNELGLLLGLAASSPGIWRLHHGPRVWRMYGNLVRTDCAAAFKAHVARRYEEATGITPDSYVCERAQDAPTWPVERRVEG